MPPRNAVHPRVLSGTLLIGAGVVFAELAWAHMRSLTQIYGVICGSGSGVLAHCPACAASGALIVAGLAALALPRAQAQTVRAR